MQTLIENIFEIEQLKSINISENEKCLREIMEKYIKEIQSISKMDDTQIENLLSKKSQLKEGTYEFKLYLSNLRYIKQTYFIDQNEKVVDKIDIDLIKDLKLVELVNVENIEVNKSLEIDYKKLEELANKKREEEEKWNNYNVVSTVSSLIGIQESNMEFISNLSQYIAFVSELNPAVNYVSRGQKNCTFELLPSLYRKHKKDFEIHSDNYESSFRQKIIYYDKEIKNKSMEELRAEGQHFGLPTNYLDFTEAHLISLLFAIEDYEYTEQHSIVYFIDSVAYNNEAVGLKEKLIDYSDSTVVDSVKRYSSRSYFIKLGNSNERIHFQKGCFLKVSPQDNEEFKKRLSDFGKAVIINKNEKKKILKELFNLGITFENIYPDKDNVVKSIKFYYQEMLGGND